MFSKCECCRFYRWSNLGFAYCKNPATQKTPDFCSNLEDAKKICDPEGDGSYVHFEPKDPSAGAACFVQITREPVKAMAAGA